MVESSIFLDWFFPMEININKPSSYWTIPEQTMESPSYEGGFSSYDETGR